MVYVEYLGTRKATAPYRFFPVWIDVQDDNRPILSKKKPRTGRGAKSIERWSGVNPAEHVLDIEINLNRDGALSAATMERLGRWTPIVMA